MKRSLIFLTMSLIAVAAVGFKAPSDVQKLSATFKGLNEDYQYLFKDQKGVEHVFDLIGDEVEIELDSEEYVNKKFDIQWIYVDIEDSDEDNEDENIDEEDDGESSACKKENKMTHASSKLFH